MNDKPTDPSTNAPAPPDGEPQSLRPDGLPSSTREEPDQEFEEALKDEMAKDGAGGD
jgi:hypothetical protein